MNSLLENIDNFLSEKTEQEQKMFFFLPIILFAFVSYYIVFPITDEDLKKAVKKEKSLKSNISKTKSSNRHLKTSNLQTKHKLKQVAIDIKELDKKKVDVNILVKQLGFLRFNLSEWAKFYNTIPKLAMKNNLYIRALDNYMFLGEDDKLVQEKMKIKIVVLGNFINFVKFINEFETKKELIKIKSIQIEMNQMIVDIDVYGAKL